MIDTDVLDTGLGDADDDDFDETVEVDDAQLPDHRYTDRELSWLAFNQRVLELAEDPTLPALERANFLAIFASNLDEFFMVRVAGLKRRIVTGLAVPTNVGRAPQDVLADISEAAHALQVRHALAWLDLVHPALSEAGIHVIDWREKNNQAASVGRERYSKYVKSIVAVGAPDDFYRQPVGFPIEIIPESDPTKLKAGDTLSIRVLFRGRPASDLQIETAWLTPEGKSTRKPAGRTDREGRFAVPIGSRGIWKLHTVLMERCQEPSVADWESFWTSLTFEVEK